MSELAFDKEGNPFRFSRRTKKLRPRRWKNAGQRGTCAAVLDPDGEPLFLDADAEYVDFRAAVGNVPGFYRLDQCDEDGTPIEDVPPAYVSIESTRNAAPLGDVDPRDAIIRDLAQINADVTRTIAERFSNVMQAAADVLRAADGAGMSRRMPPPPAPVPTPTPEHDADDEEDDDHESEDEESEPMPPANPFGPLQPLVEIAMPHLPKFGAFLWVKFQEFMRQNATPPSVASTHPAPAPGFSPGPAQPAPAPEPVGAAGPSAAAASTAPMPPSSPPSSAAAPPTSMPAGGTTPQAPNGTPPPPATASEYHADVTPPADGIASAASGLSVAPPPVAPSPDAPSPSATPSAPPSTATADAPRNAPPAPMTEPWAHLRTILARLSPREAAITETVIGRMPLEVRMSWLTELSALGVDQAVEAVRSMIPVKPQAAAEAAAVGTSTKPPALPATKPRVPTEFTTSEALAMAPEAPPRPAKHGSAAPTDPTTAVKLPESHPAMEHFLAIQAALTPEEAAFMRTAVSALSPADLNALIDELSAMSVSEALDRVRALLAEASQPGAA
jgi:hypothetical protein